MLSLSILFIVKCRILHYWIITDHFKYNMMRSVSRSVSETSRYSSNKSKVMSLQDSVLRNMIHTTSIHESRIIDNSTADVLMVATSPLDKVPSCSVVLLNEELSRFSWHSSGSLWLSISILCTNC